MYIFFHVPKAAGTTIRESIRHQIAAQSVLNLGGSGGLSFLADEAINSAQLISGHVGIDLLRRIHVPYRALTFLRDPVQRAFSHYRFFKNMAKRAEFFFKKNFFMESFEAVLRDTEIPLIESAFRNTQTWFFASDWEASNRNRSLGDFDVLEMAKNNIQERLEAFGLVEEMELSLRLINRHFNWSLLSDQRLNVTPEDEEELTPELISLIQDHNQLDIELYGWAQKVFRDRCVQWLDAETITLLPNDFSGDGWLNGVHTQNGAKTFYFLAPILSELKLKIGDVLKFATTGQARVLKIEKSKQNGVCSVFVTLDRSLDPVGDGFPNKVLVYPQEA